MLCAVVSAKKIQCGGQIGFVQLNLNDCLLILKNKPCDSLWTIQMI